MRDRKEKKQDCENAKELILINEQNKALGQMKIVNTGDISKNITERQRMSRKYDYLVSQPALKGARQDTCQCQEWEMIQIRNRERQKQRQTKGERGEEFV